MTDGSSWSVARLEVADLRCWHRARLDLPDGLVVLAGPNGAGKTSLVEAVVLAAVGVSPRTAQMSELVRHGAPALHVAASLSAPGAHGGITTRRDIGYAARTGRRLGEDGEPVRTLAAWRRPGAVLVFVPEELRAVKGPPGARRRALDRLLEAVEPGFTAALGDQADALAQRNALLRRARAAGAEAAGLAAAVPWEAQLARAGARVQNARRAAVERLREPFGRWLADLGGGAGGRLRLESSPGGLAGTAPDDLEEGLVRYLRENRGRDLAAGMTLGGPHRDDLWIGREDHDIRRLGSQGEQRTAALALLLAHREVLEAEAARPVLLLDDVLSELDPVRRRALVEAVSQGGQALITTADPDLPGAVGAGHATLVRVPEDVGGG